MLDMDQVAADVADAISAPGDAALSKVSALAQQQVLLEDEIADLELIVSNRKKDLRTLQCDHLPAALAEAGLAAIELQDGSKITVKPYYDTSIPERMRDAAFEWLREHGHGDLIKRELKVSFGMGEDEQAQQARDALALLEAEFSDKETVHPSTLKAFVKEQVEAGAEGFPLDLFGAQVGQRATIKRKGN